MSILEFFSGSKSYIAGTALILLAVAQIATVGASCFQGTITLAECWIQLSTGWSAMQDAFLGLGIIGMRHAIEKAS